MNRRLFAVPALVSLAVCLAVPVAHFLGHLTVAQFRLYLLLASLGWFVFAPLWTAAKKKS